MADLQKEAEERGLELNQLIEIRTMEKENAELKWQMRLKELKRFAEQAVKAQDDFPEFDLSIEWKNLIFRQITGRFGMLVAYEITHFHECYFQEQQSQTIPEQIVEEAERLFCRKCGTQLLTDSVYCNKCGTKVETL
jgi:ribosomal protein L40E